MKKKILLFFIISIFIFSLLPIFNYYVDIARVFTNDYKKHYKGQLSNELYLQSKYLLDNPKITKIIFGSSRIGNGFDLQGYDGWYKAWNQGANLVEHQKTLQYILNHKKQIEEVIIAIDHLSFFSNAKNNDYFRQNPPDDFMSIVKFYNFYLYRIPSKKDFDAFINNKLVKNRKHIFSNIGNSHNQKQTYFMNQNMFQSKRRINEVNYKRNLLALENIKQLCEMHNIKFSFFIQPFHYKNLLGQDPDFINRYTKDLLSISDEYLNCSKLDNYKIDNKYWVDVSHYNVKLGELIIRDIILGENNICIGLNKVNVGDYVETEAKNISHSLYDLVENDMKVIPHNGYFSKKIFSKKINKTKVKKFKFKKNILSGNDLFILINIQTFKPTKVTLQYNTHNKEYHSQTKLFKYDGWPKVSNLHEVFLHINSQTLNQHGFSLIADEDVDIQKVTIFKR